MAAVVVPSRSCSMQGRLSSLAGCSGGDDTLEGVLGGSLQSEDAGDPHGDVDDFLSRIF